MENYKVALISPKSSLPFAEDEVMQVNNFLKADLIQGQQATIHGLLSLLDKPYDILWFATHGDENGVYLNDGILSTSEVTTLAKLCGPSLLVLNTCSSRQIALELYAELQVPVVCTITDVPDRTAYLTGSIFAKRISQGLPFREAYEQAKPGQNTTYTFLPEEREVYMPPSSREPVDGNFSEMVNSLRRLEIVVSGSKDYNVKGLVPQVDFLIEKFAILEKQQAFNRRLLLTITGILVLFAFVLPFVYYGR